MSEDCKRYAHNERRLQHADWHKAPPEELRSIYSPWPFHTWGIDILGPFPLAIRQMKYLVVAIEYFTKWIEAKPVAQITVHTNPEFHVEEYCVSFWCAQASCIRQWDSVRKPPVEEAVQGHRDTTGVCFRGTPANEWAGGVR